MSLTDRDKKLVYRSSGRRLRLPRHEAQARGGRRGRQGARSPARSPRQGGAREQLGTAKQTFAADYTTVIASARRCRPTSTWRARSSNERGARRTDIDFGQDRRGHAGPGRSG